MRRTAGLSTGMLPSDSNDSFILTGSEETRRPLVSQMSPSPCPVMTFPARKPAIAPTMMKTIRFISDETSSLPRSHHLTAPVARQTAQGTFPPEKKALDAAAQRDVLLRHRAPSSQEMEPP